MSWAFEPAKKVFEEVANDWDVLNRARGNHILLDSRFVGSLIRHFGNEHVLLGISKDSRKPGNVLVIKKHPGIWETFQPGQGPLGLIVLGSPDETGEALGDIMHSLPGYALQLAVLQQDPDHSCFSPVPKRPNLEYLEYIRTARLLLQGIFESYWQSRSTNLRHNLSRQRRRLEEQGRKLELVTHRSPESVAACVREYGRLESEGWKGKAGTAIAEDNTQGRFYREVFEAFCVRGEAVIYQLLLDGKIAASDLCLQRNGTLMVLKTAYQEALKSFSPGLLMRQEIVRQLYAEDKIRVVEFYGQVLDWHTKWTERIRTMYHLNCFRNGSVAGLRRLIKRFA